MAKIKSGILSKVQGKVAGVVGATWKGQNYLRELVKPGNPNTPAQQLQRGKMSVAVKASRTFLAPVLSPFVGKFVKNMSAYNWFVKQNIATSASESTDIKDLMLSFGSMTPPSLDVSNCSIASGGLHVEGITVPAVPAGHKCYAVMGICTPDAETSSYSITEKPAGALVGSIVSALSLEFTGEIFVTVFFADVTDYGTSSQKVWAVSNSATVKFTAT